MSEPRTSQDEELLRQLGELAKEGPGSAPAGLDERWDRLAAGTLSAEEDAELRRLAAGSEEARVAYEAFQPLGGEFRAAAVRAIRAEAARPAGKVVPFRPALRRVAAWTAAAAAAAAAVVLLLRPAAPLPAYSVAEVSGGSRTTRSETTTLDLMPGDRFQLGLRPQTAVAGGDSLRAAAYLQRGDELRPVDVESRVDPRGAVRLQGVLPEDLAPGDWMLWAVVGRGDELPDVAELRPLLTGPAVRRRAWAAVPVTLRIGPPAP